jgi:hypothetical protein
MCVALLIATGFLGQARSFPNPLRDGALLAIPMMAVLLTMLYWLTRIPLTQQHPRPASLPRAGA